MGTGMVHAHYVQTFSLVLLQPFSRNSKTRCTDGRTFAQEDLKPISKLTEPPFRKSIFQGLQYFLRSTRVARNEKWFCYITFAFWPTRV